MANQLTFARHMVEHEKLGTVSTSGGPYSIAVDQLKQLSTNNTGASLAQYAIVGRSGTAGEMLLCDPTDPTTMPAFGILSLLVADTDSSLVVTAGPITITGATFTPKAPVFVGTDGQPSQAGDGNFPVAAGSLLQIIGYAQSATIFDVTISPEMTVVGG